MSLANLRYTAYNADVLGIRLEPAERKALDAAAREDQRPVSALVRKIVLDWLRERGLADKAAE